MAMANEGTVEPQPNKVAGIVTVSTKFPGGNGLITKNEPGIVSLEPDLRGDSPWFYWSIEVTAVEAGLIQFVTPEKVIGFENGAIGLQGPAVSTDGGETWNWMGTEAVQKNTFTYHFAKAGDVVQFAVTLPYVSSTLNQFLKRHARNEHLHQTLLTKSREGRDVILLIIGTPGADREAILVTARHHATETIASYLLEGIIEEAISDSPDGKIFRERFVMYVVPFVDQDGVEKGDQGKNRKPHDHNRDYGNDSIYPEVKAIKQLQEEHHFRYALDLHCPTLVMPDHQVLHFVGPKNEPDVNLANVTTFAERIKSGLPKTAPVGPLVWLKDLSPPATMFSRYFGTQPGVIMAATLEIPFAPPSKKTDPASCREYGRVFLQSLVATRFVDKTVPQ